MARKVKSARLTTRAAAEAYIGGVCFKLGPPRLIGAELEWLTLPARDGDPPGPCRPDLQHLATVLGPHAPTAIAPDSPARSLPAGSAVTLEPGGQIELSSIALPSVEDLCAALTADTDLLRRRLARADITMVDSAADVWRRADRILPAPRYRAMEQRFDRIGPFGRLMMCNTAATQVSVDAGVDAAEVANRWKALYAMGPALLAAFACSPRLRGIPEGDWASQRMRAWLELDPGRTDPPPLADPIAGYGRWALDAPLLCVFGGCGDRPDDWALPREPSPPRESLPSEVSFADWMSGALDAVIGRRPDHRDLDYHLSTLFPPVRAAGHLEVRYLDAQPGRLWGVPIVAVDALLRGRATVAEAAALSAGTAGRWREAAELGLRDAELRCAAADLLSLAASASRSFAPELEAAAQRCRDGRTPAQEADQ